MENSNNELLDMRISAVQTVARDINLYRLTSVSGTPVATATAGAHIDVHLDNGLVRQYSLIIKDEKPHEYVIGIKRDAASRGGSTYIHNHFRVGTVVKIGGPRNHFPLDETAAHTELIAGGIGITPIYSMVQRLIALGNSWRLYYASRSRADMAFLEELPSAKNLQCHFDDESGGRFLDIDKILHNAPTGSHFYCCGPRPLMESFEKAATAVPAEQKHLEYFSPRETAALEGGFTVKLAKSGRTLTVPPGRSILEIITEAGVHVDCSCTEGICGTCETKVLEGTPDHRDSVLSPAERKANNTMMICCSGSQSAELVLDL